MKNMPPRVDAVSRRMFLSFAAALAPAAGLGLGLRPAFAEGETGATTPAAAQQFSFDLLSAEMKALATQPYATAPAPSGFLGEMTYDDYRLIRFRDEHVRWNTPDSAYRLGAFHMGWLFPEPVRIFELADGMATEMLFTTDDFEYLNELAARVPEHAELPGVAGFRLNFPLNRPDKMDELGAFLGASYFRLLGRGSAYGLSARGLALNTATSEGEEFPRFSRYYMERNGDVITIYAALEGPSVTGAYKFVITPGVNTVAEVTKRLYFRKDVIELGVAPLTSMFLFSEKNRSAFDDFRPNVHDSEGLRIIRSNGDPIWRPLNNPPQLAGSYFAETSPQRFGLHQRDRRFESYQDTGAHYELRPSVDIEPIGDWGKGAVRLVEIPSDLEANDNIVAYWIPEAPAKAGDALEYSYRLHWGNLPLDPLDALAFVDETRSGHGGVSGVEAAQNTRKFVVDFRGGMLAELDAETVLEPIVSVTNGELLGSTLDKIVGTDVWRLALDVGAAEGAVVELSAHVAGFNRKLTETWLYQWINAK